MDVQCRLKQRCATCEGIQVSLSISSMCPGQLYISESYEEKHSLSDVNEKGSRTVNLANVIYDFDET